MKFQQCLWDLEEQEPQAISQAECAHIYNGEPVYYFGNTEDEQQDQEQFNQAKQQLIELLEKVTNTIPDHDPNVTDQHGNPKPINKQPLIDFRHKVTHDFNLNVSLDTRQSLLNPIKKDLEDLYTNHASRLEQAKGFTPNTLELNSNDLGFNICWQGVATKLREFIDSIRLDKSFHQLVAKAKRQMLWGLASFYVAPPKGGGEVHTTARYFNSLAPSYGLMPVEWESSSIYDIDGFLNHVVDNRDSAFWEQLIALMDNYFPKEVDDEMNLITNVSELMGEVVPKDDNNSAWWRFFVDDDFKPGCLEEQTRQRLARLCTSYMMAQQGYLSPDYCRTLKVEVVHNSDNNQNIADSIEVLSSKRLLPDDEKWTQQASDQSQTDRGAGASSAETGSSSGYTGSALQSTSNTETLYYYITDEDIFIHTEEGIIRPAGQEDLMLIKDDLKDYQLPVLAKNLQYLDRDFIFELSCLPSITMPSLGMSLTSQMDLASDDSLKNYIKQQFIQHYGLLILDIEGVNYDRYKIKSPLLHTLFWQLYKDNLNSNELTDEDRQCFRQLTGCYSITTLNELNEWLINNTDHPFLQGTDNLSTINHLFWQVYEAYHDGDQFLPRDTQFFQVVTGNCDLKSQSEVQDWLIESVVRGNRSGADLPFSLIMFAAQNDYEKAVQDFFNNCLNKQVAWYQFGDSFGRNILHIAMCQFDIAYDFLSQVWWTPYLRQVPF